MSLKYFHIFFIIMSSLLSFFFSYWCFQAYVPGDYAYGLSGFFSAIAGIGLLVYLRSVFRKLKNVGFFLIPFLTFSIDSFSCAVCYGDPNHPQSKGLTAAVLFLLGVIGFVLFGFVALIIYHNIKAKQVYVQQQLVEGR